MFIYYYKKYPIKILTLFSKHDNRSKVLRLLCLLMKNVLETKYKNKQLFPTYRLNLSTKTTKADTTTALSNDDITMIIKWLLVSSLECSETGLTKLWKVRMCINQKHGT